MTCFVCAPKKKVIYVKLVLANWQEKTCGIVSHDTTVWTLADLFWEGWHKEQQTFPLEEYDGYHMDGMAISSRPQLTSVHVSPSHLSASFSLKWLNSWWMNDSFAVPHSLKSEDITTWTHKTHVLTHTHTKITGQCWWKWEIFRLWKAYFIQKLFFVCHSGHFTIFKIVYFLNIVCSIHVFWMQGICG